MYQVTTYLTNNINAPNGLLTNIWGHTVTPSSACFNYGQTLEFEWIRGPYGGHHYDMAFNGWFVFDACDAQFHLGRLPLYVADGAQLTSKVKLRMRYSGNVIVVAELT